MMTPNEIKIHSLVACCNNGGIGYKGALPWHLPKEYKYFSKLSTGKPPEGRMNVVVMGRKTWDSIPDAFKPLKNRYNIVLSRTLDETFKGPDAVVSSLEALIALLQSDEWKDKIYEIYNVGGSAIYELIHSSPYCGRIYLTRVLADFACDTFFPSLGKEFKQLPAEKFPNIPQGVQEEKEVQWKVEVYEK